MVQRPKNDKIYGPDEILDLNTLFDRSLFL